MDGDRHHSRVLPGAGGYSTHHELPPPYLHISTHISTHIYTDTLPLHSWSTPPHEHLLGFEMLLLSLGRGEAISWRLLTGHCPHWPTATDTKFRTFASEKYFVNRSSRPIRDTAWRDTRENGHHSKTFGNFGVLLESINFNIQFLLSR